MDVLWAGNAIGCGSFKDWKGGKPENWTEVGVRGQRIVTTPEDEGLATNASFVAYEKDSNGNYRSYDGSVIEGALSRGVDVSEWQIIDDWAALKADDIAGLQLCGELPRKRPCLLDGTDLKRAGHPYSSSVPL